MIQKEKLTTTPKVHFSKKQPITELKIVANSEQKLKLVFTKCRLNQLTFNFWITLSELGNHGDVFLFSNSS